MKRIERVDRNVNTNAPVIHGDYDPLTSAYYCAACRSFSPTDAHLLGAEHEATQHLSVYLRGLSAMRRMPPELNFFTLHVFHGREPDAKAARLLAELVWRCGPIDITDRKVKRVALDAAIRINGYRAMRGG